MTHLRETELQVDLGRLKANYHILRSLSKHEFFCPMIKADAYGHGDLEVAKALAHEGCRNFGVALYEEAFHLRERGFSEGRLFVFAPCSESALRNAAALNVTPVILCDHDLEVLEACSARFEKPLTVHVKFNVGMNRLGLAPADAEKTAARLKKLSKVHVEALCTHLSNAEDFPEPNGVTQNQLAAFEKIFEFFQPNVFGHVLNSAGLVAAGTTGHPSMENVGARPGIAVYGICPAVAGVDPQTIGLREVMTLRTRLVHAQNVVAGDGVSYGAQWKASKKSVIGVLPVGYADGLRRGLSGRIQTEIDGRMFPLVGIVCMDYAMVDLTDSGWSTTDAVGKAATLLAGGRNGLSTAVWAEKLNTISYEVMTGLSARVPRMYL